MEIQDCRSKINIIDEQLVDLFAQRMQLEKKIDQYKAENHLPVFDHER